MPPGSTLVTNILSDPVKLLEVVGAIIAILVGLITIGAKLLHKWRTWSDRRSLRNRLGAERYTPEDILRATTHYIKPNCQSIDPAQGEEGRLVYAVQSDLFNETNRLLGAPWEHKYSILLADSGMGKTSFVLNYYAYHWRRRRRRNCFDLAVVPLGIPNADQCIGKIQKKENTTLFLDAFDEDTRAIQDHRKRLGQLLELCRDFRQVLITCRTQFFPKDEEIPRETGIIKIGPTASVKEHLFYKLYLSPFSDQQVEAYLKRRFPIWKRQWRKQSRMMVEKIPHLTARPMLLSHIRELVQSGRTFEYAFQLYEEMVKAWLKREQPFVKDKESLRQFSERLAVDLYVNRESRGAERIPREELSGLAAEWNIPLDGWQLTGRSLLNRDAVGNYKFAHRSIMEYLFVKRFTEGDKACNDITWTDQMKTFLVEMIRKSFDENQQLSFSLEGADLSNIEKPLYALRSYPTKLNYVAVESLIRKYDFYDSDNNAEGRGGIHYYQSIEKGRSKIVMDHATGLTWQQDGSENAMNFKDAGEYIQKLNDEKYGGYDDWRLPTLEEAMSLMEPQRHGDLHLDPVFDREQRWIWTADKERTARAWVVSFYYGLCGDYHVGITLNYVRAVR